MNWPHIPKSVIQDAHNAGLVWLVEFRVSFTAVILCDSVIKQMVPRKLLCTVIIKMGIPQEILVLIQKMYVRNEAQVKI